MSRSLLALGFALILAPVSMAQVVPMTNDNCGSAIAVFDGVNPGPPAGVSGMVYTSVGATASAGSPTCVAATNLDVWFTYTATATGVFTVETCIPTGFAAGTLADTTLQ